MKIYLFRRNIKNYMKNNNDTSIPGLIEAKKKWNRIIKAAYNKTKPDKCVLCNESKNSYCNSHSIPQFSLRAISGEGELLQASALYGSKITEDKKGVKNSGTFHIICKSCDNLFFRDYENTDNILKQPTSKMLGEIAVKNILLEMSKRFKDSYLYQQEIPSDTRLKEITLDLNDYFLDFEANKKVVDNNIENTYKILFWDILPYKIPIATQAVFALDEDYEGNPINDIYDYSPDICMQYIHILTLPLEGQSVVLAFYHEKDTLYNQLSEQFKNISKNEALEYLNYIIFCKSENYYISTKIENEILSNETLLDLVREGDGLLDYDSLFNKEPIEKNQIPNLLSKEWSI